MSLASINQWTCIAENRLSFSQSLFSNSFTDSQHFLQKGNYASPAFDQKINITNYFYNILSSNKDFLLA